MQVETKNYYDTLQISKGATDVEIKKAYRKLAMKWHPDKNPDNSEEASKKFQEIGEAYDVLSDLQKRAIYDQYGYEGLRDGIPDSSGSMNGYSYNNNAQEIFENFFGTTNPFASFGFGESAPFSSKLNRPGPKKPEPIVYNLECSLAELYNGCIKKYCITRKRFDQNKQLVEESKNLSITIKPGWKKGTKITFPGEGDEGENISPPDVIFVIQEKPNSDIGWVRDGNNLVYTYKLSLSDALTDCSLQIPTLDKRILSIACPEVVSPYYEKVVVGEGMPVSKKGDGSKGDLIIKFYIQFPKYLNGTKRNKLREILANEDYTTV